MFPAGFLQPPSFDPKADDASNYGGIGMVIGHELGENIADLGGLTMAYHAYRRSLDGKPAPVIDGLTGDQRFFLGLAQSWRNKMRPESIRQMVLTNPHSPPVWRVNGVVANMAEFRAAFGCKPGDPMARAGAEQIEIW